MYGMSTIDQTSLFSEYIASAPSRGDSAGICGIRAQWGASRGALHQFGLLADAPMRTWQAVRCGAHVRLLIPPG
jgi:hypothetical protein